MVNERLVRNYSFSTVIAFIALMVFAALYDLKINIAFYNPDSLFGDFFKRIGEIPLNSALLISSIIIYQYLSSIKARRIYRIISLIGVYSGSFMLINMLAGYLMKDEVNQILYIIFFSLMFGTILIALTNSLDKELLKKLLYFAVFLLLLAIILRVSTAITKEVWLRLRFINMDHNTYAGFTPWWRPNFTVSGREHYATEFTASAFRSFISGHTTGAGVVFAVIILPDIFLSLRKYALWFYIAPLIYTLLVALSRIVLGAHYLSDVTASLMLSSSVALGLRKLNLAKYLKT